MLLRRVWVVLILCIASTSSLSSAATGMDILGTHYSQKLAELAARVEKTIGNEVLFVPKLTPGDNSGHFVKGGAYEITLKPGSSEDDVAHELVHPLLSTAGYTMIFFIPGNRFSQTIYPFIASDFDHLFINRWLHEEGYYPEKGFMVGMKDQYKAFAADKGFADIAIHGVPEQRASLGVAVIHQLMKHVYYVGSPQAESAILAAYPMYRNHWFTLKREIDLFLKDPTPTKEWSLVRTYNVVMGDIFSEAGMAVPFSDLIGFAPLPVASALLDQPASSVLSAETETATGIVRFKADKVLVAAGGANVPNLSSPLRDVAKALNLRLLY